MPQLHFAIFKQFVSKDSNLTNLPTGPRTHRVQDMRSTFELSEQHKDQLGIIYPSMNNPDLLNIYRELRNKLLRLSGERNFTCLVSALDDEGDSSLLAMNLAALIAFDRSRSALIIDCDTNWSMLDEICAQSDDVGLIDFIENDLDDISTLIHESGVDRVRIVPSGNATYTKTEIFDSVRMREIITELKERYPDRYLVINASNMSLSSEVQILSNIVDIVVFELLSSTVTKDQVTDAVEMIGQDKIAGIVFRHP